jgi:hypothetical protein
MLLQRLLLLEGFIDEELEGMISRLISERGTARLASTYKCIILNDCFKSIWTN